MALSREIFRKKSRYLNRNISDYRLRNSEDISENTLHTIMVNKACTPPSSVLPRTFVGSNNINLMAPNGQFGTRAQGGSDAASPRYIFTQLLQLHGKSSMLPMIHFSIILTKMARKIEPEWYMPVIPMVLVNGADGIGTGNPL